MNLDDISLKIEGRFRQAFLDAVRLLREKIDAIKLATLIRDGKVAEALGVVNQKLVAEGYEPFVNVVEHQVIFAGLETAKPYAAYGVVFRPAHTATLDWLRNYSMNLIREMTQDSLASVREAIHNGVKDGRNPKVMANDVRNFIGLTQRQTQAVLNYRAALENATRDGLQRALRDRRFDGSVSTAILERKPLPQAKINNLVARYAGHYLRYRAQTIARTEAQRASNGGAYQTWQQAVSYGKIPVDAIMRRWVYTHDSRTRNGHREIPGMNPSGVGLNEPFDTPLGPLMYPGDPAGDPANTINCRCTLTYKVDVAMMRKAA